MRSDKLIIYFLTAAMFLFSTCLKIKKDFVLENENISLSVRLDESNLPYIRECTGNKNEQVLFTGKFCKSSGNILFGSLYDSKVSFREDEFFKYLEASGRNDSLEFKWIYKLLNNSNSYSLQLKIKNLSIRNLAITEYPVLNEMIIARESMVKIKSWKSLYYKPEVKELTGGTDFSISSVMYSSEEPNEVPYWELSINNASIFFGLAWSGGWRSNFTRTPDAVSIYTFLPAEETQLVLKPGEEIMGPEIVMTITDMPTEMQKRQVWLKNRESWAKVTYPKPVPSYPLIYNSWYAIRFNLSKDFIVYQL